MLKLIGGFVLLKKDNYGTRGPGKFFLGCVAAENTEYGSDVFDFPDGKFRAIFIATTKKSAKELTKEEKMKLSIAEVDFTGAGTISSKLAYHFVKWFWKAS